MEKIDAGSQVVNKLLDGGYEPGIITTIFGPAGSGKTTFCMLASIHCSNSKKVIYIDTEGGFSAERLKQLAGDAAIKNILVLKPMNFDEQVKAIENLKDMVNERIGLVVVDTISMLYRVEISRRKEPKSVYNELDLQISYLTEIARRNNIPVLVTNQVYADFDEKDAVKMVGGDMLKYSSKCLIELIKFKTRRKAIIKKHRSIADGKEVVFEIEEKDLKEAIIRQ